MGISPVVSVWQISALMTAFKLLLIPTYHSTDFEVHRNWLAITHSLPIKRWYTEDTSEWTLDYPPLFAWFEYLLAQVAYYFDPKMLEVTNLNYASTETIIFQRLSVIATDLVYMYAVKEYCQYWSTYGNHIPAVQVTTATVLLLSNFGLLIVDHIHFQYNGFLFGVLLLSMVRISQGHVLEGSFWFAVLLNLKHIYVYIAPAYFVYLLRNYCFMYNKPGGALALRSFSPVRFFSLGVVVVSVVVLSFGPFIAMGQLEQIISRLFPFKRGLCHAYWAPNFWALYNSADKAATVVGSQLGVLPGLNISINAAMTGGLVQQFDHQVLPSITPVVTLTLVVLAILPSLVYQWLWPSGPKGFVRSVVLCALGSFLFGWHVHEKAILMAIIPLSVLAVEKKRDAHIFLLLSTCGHYALLPLIFTPAEAPIKYCLLLFYTLLSFYLLRVCFPSTKSKLGLPFLHGYETLYVLGMLALEVYSSWGHGALGLDSRLPFLPLLMTSVYAAIGLLYVWIIYYRYVLFDSGSSRKPYSLSSLKKSTKVD